MKTLPWVEELHRALQARHSAFVSAPSAVSDPLMSRLLASTPLPKKAALQMVTARDGYFIGENVYPLLKADWELMEEQRGFTCCFFLSHEE